MKGWLDIDVLTHIIDNNKNLKLTQNQDHKFNGQRQICNFVKKKKFWLNIMNQWLNIKTPLYINRGDFGEWYGEKKLPGGGDQPFIPYYVVVRNRLGLCKYFVIKLDIFWKLIACWVIHARLKFSQGVRVSRGGAVVCK